MLSTLNPEIEWDIVVAEFNNGVSLQKLQQIHYLDACQIRAGLIALMGKQSYDAIVANRLNRLSEDEKRNIIELFKQNKPLAVIARAVHRSRATCRTAIIAEVGEDEYARLIAPRRKCTPARERMNLR